MAFPLGVLALFAAGIGFIVGPMTHWFGGYLSHTAGLSELEHHLHWSLMAISTLIAGAGVWMAYTMYVVNPSLSDKAEKASGPLFGLSQNKFYIDEILSALIVNPLRRLAMLSVLFDRKVIDGIVDGVGKLPYMFSLGPRRMHAGVVGGYACVMLIAVATAVVFVVQALGGP
jgi:NADH-quinone oxidoreductase subunit L